MNTEVLLQRDGAIATVVINSAAKRNALGSAGWHKLGEVVLRASADNDVRCVVIRGAGGGAFSSGDDLDGFEHERHDLDSARAYDAVVTRTIDSLAGCRHPVVAAIQGSCLGTGLGIAALADVRVCGESGRLGVPEGRLGLVLPVPALAALVAVAGRAGALGLLLTGDPVDAGRALALGLVHRVVPDERVDECAYETARRIAAGAPLAARAHKKLVNRLAGPDPLTDEERDESLMCFGSADFHEGRSAFLERRPPRFRGH